MLKEKLAYTKRVVSWARLSSQGKAVTHADWYEPKITIPNRADPKPITVDYAANPFSQATLNRAHRYLNRHHTRAFLLVHRGRLVHEHYVNFTAHDVFNSMSLVKSLLGVCIGIAIDRRMIVSVDDLACDYLHEWRGDARRFITLEHLLSMQSGLFSDVALPLNKPSMAMAVVPLYLGGNIHDHALSAPAITPPNKHFIYNNFNSQLLGIILERASGLTFAQFVGKYLWQPLSCGRAYTWADVLGKSHTFGAFFASPRDWLKLGQLFLQEGVFEGVQIVPKAWLEYMQTPSNTPEKGIKDGRGDFGHHLWLKAHDYGPIAGIPRIEGAYAKAPLKDDTMTYFEGMRGQYLYISKKHDFIMLRMGERPRRDWDASLVVNELVDELSAIG